MSREVGISFLRERGGLGLGGGVAMAVVVDGGDMMDVGGVETGSEEVFGVARVWLDGW